MLDVGVEWVGGWVDEEAMKVMRCWLPLMALACGEVGGWVGGVEKEEAVRTRC